MNLKEAQDVVAFWVARIGKVVYGVSASSKSQSWTVTKGRVVSVAANLYGTRHAVSVSMTALPIYKTQEEVQNDYSSEMIFDTIDSALYKVASLIESTEPNS